MDQVEEWMAESQLAMKGWNFSNLDGQWKNEPLPWSYRDLVKANLEDNMMWHVDGFYCVVKPGYGK